MEGATNYDNVSALNTPENQVIGVLPADYDLETLLQELHAQGIPEEKIGVLVGDEDARKLEPVAGEKGLVSAVVRGGLDLGDVDRDYLQKYPQAVRQGGCLIGVVETDGERRREIGRLLSRHGALLVNSFGQFSVEGIR
jgi:hypothetical protein